MGFIFKKHHILTTTWEFLVITMVVLRLHKRREFYDKGTKAMFSLIGKCRKLDLPIDIQIMLFNSLVKPIVLYGAEV